MPLIVADRVKEGSTTTGTGAFTLAGAAVGFRAFSTVCSVGDTCYYTIQSVDNKGVPTAAWEVGIGTYSAANTLTRTTVLASSNAGAAVNFAAGTKQVWIDLAAAQIFTNPMTAGGDLIIGDGENANVALNGLGISVSMSTGDGADVANHPASHAFDGNDSTYAQTAWYFGTVIFVDLGAAKSIRSFRVKQLAGLGYKAQYSVDNSTWVDAPGSASSALDTGTVTFATDITARYWQLVKTGTSGSNWQVTAFELYAAVTLGAPKRLAKGALGSYLGVTALGLGYVSPTLAALVDAGIASPTNGQLLQYDAASGKWKNASAMPKLTILQRAVAQTIATGGWVDVSWDTAVQDDVGAFSSGTPTRVTVPAGYAKVRITSYVAWSNNSGGVRYHSISKNSVSGQIGPTIKLDSRGAANESGSTITSRWLTVTPGDYFIIGVNQTSGTSLTLSGPGATSFAGPTEVQFEWMP